ncbi:MAG: hypothetical protein QHH80_05805 [Anaerolineae bacterium]|nr:hypothetical protein [Anaerolineae bacterium]
MSANVVKESVEHMAPADLYSQLFQAPVAVVPEERWPAVLETLGIQRSPKALPTCPPSYSLILRHQKTLQLARCSNLPLLFLGYAPVFSGQRVYHGRDCDWAMMHVGDDPVFRLHGQRLYAPKPVRAHLEKITEAGIEFDAIFIAREIPAGSVKPGEPIPLELLIPPPHPEARERLNTFERAAMNWWNFVAKVLTATARGIAAGAVAVAAAGAGVGALAALDPVLFGVQFDATWHTDGHPIGMWYYLTHWDWSA